MSQKKPNADKLKNTLNELDFALEQWDSITSKPESAQAPEKENELQKRAKTLLKELRDQLEEFSKESPSQN